MKLFKRLLFISLSASVLSAFWLPEAGAGHFEDAHAGLTKAYNDFFTAAGQSSGSRQDLSRLSTQIMSPAIGNLNQAIKESQAQTMKNIVRNHAPNALLRGGKKISWAKGAKGKSDSSAVAPVRQSAPAAAPKPKVILDGSKVPREIEFGQPSSDSQNH